MPFSSSAAGSPHRRYSANLGGYSGAAPRDKVSWFVLLSILVFAYSGVTLGLLLLNKGASSDPPLRPEAIEVGGSGGGGNRIPLIPPGSEAVERRNPLRSTTEKRATIGQQGERLSAASGLAAGQQTGVRGGADITNKGAAFDWETADVALAKVRAFKKANTAEATGAFGAEAKRGNESGRERSEGGRQEGEQAEQINVGDKGKEAAKENAADKVKVKAQGAVVKSNRKRSGGSLYNPPMEQPFDVTLVSQTSRNRFWMLPFLCKRWPGPISIAILNEDREDIPSELCTRMVISSTAAQSVEELDPIWYPVNRLRNVAVRAVKTTHFLMTDIDIWPDVHAYHALHMRYILEQEKMDDARNAIVFSAFSRRRFCEEQDCLDYANDVPETITDLKPCLETNTCGRFDAANQSGQGTAYVYYWRSMLRQPAQRTLEHIMCFKSHRFEPYLVVRKTNLLPMFDERFLGYGKNKIQWINHLRYSGFSFYVMPVNFVIHAPHPKSDAKTSWEKTGGGKQGKGNKLMDQIFDQFMAELREEKGPEEDTVTGLCQSRNPG